MLPYLFASYVLLSVAAFLRYILNPDRTMAAEDGSQSDAAPTTAGRRRSADLSCDLPALLRTSIDVTTSDQMDVLSASPSGPTGLHLKRGDDGASVVIYHVSPAGPAARASPPLPSGSDAELELLAVNDRRVRGVVQAEDLLVSFATTGTVELLVSVGRRPRGCVHLLAGNFSSEAFSSSEPEPQDNDSHRGSIDGLEVDDSDGRVRVVVPPTAGSFKSLKFNGGDAILSIDGAPVSTIGEARAVLKARAGGTIVPILTYNCFRKLKSKVMMDTMRVVKGWPTSRRDAGRGGTAVNIEESYDVHEKVSLVVRTERMTNRGLEKSAL